MENKLPLPPPKRANETDLIVSAAAREAFGFAPYAGKSPSGPFVWPDEAKQILAGVEAGLSPEILRDYTSLKTLSARSPASMAVTLIHALQDGFLSLKLVTQLDQAWHQLKLLERTLLCAIEALEMASAQAEVEAEHRLLRRLTHRINFAKKTLNQLREFVK